MMAMPGDKTLQMAHAEDVESGHYPKDGANHRQSTKHGDRALAIVGDQRVELTDEDVSGPVGYI